MLKRVAPGRQVFAAASLAAIMLSVPVDGYAQAPPAPEAVVDGTGVAQDWQRSLSRALTYQSIVLATDQVLYWVIVTGTTATELEFFAANAVSGVGYFVAFDQGWTAAGLDPSPGESQVSVGKAVAYRVIDTARVFAITQLLGTPIAASLGVTAAIAATRTVIYMLHDYAWSWVGAAPAAG